MLQTTSEAEIGRRIDVTVVIVNYNVREFLAQALQSVERASKGLDVEVFVVDNNSIDGSVEMVRADFPGTKVLANTENIGFGRANNQAIRPAKGRHILILNPDTILQEDTLTTLVSYMDAHPDCGAAGPQILNPDGSFAPESRRSFPTPQAAFYRMTGLSRVFPRSRTFGKYNLSFLSKDEESAVDALSGSCMMVRRAALLGGESGETDATQPNVGDPMPWGARPTDSAACSGAGLFDEDFFMYGEDLDLCFRIQQAGWTIRYVPQTRIIHYKGESTKKGELRYVRLFYGAMLLFIEKHLENRHSVILFGLLRTGIMFRAAATVLGSWIRAAAAPLTDFILTWAVVSGMGVLRSIAAGADTASLLFLIVAPAYAAATVAGVAGAGCYRTGGIPPTRRIVGGVLTGFLIMAAGSYFIRSMAFSRIVIATSLPLTAALLVAWRSFAGMRRGPDSAVLVGGPDEAIRLANLLIAHPMPPFRLAGFVTPEPDADPTPVRPGEPLALGRLSHLRDLVRLGDVREIVFAAGDVSNQVIFETMQSLRNLPVQFRMLNEGKEHVIGKASVNHLSVAGLQTDLPEVVVLRSGRARNMWQRSLALVLLGAIPFLWIASRFTPGSSRLRSALLQLKGMGKVVTGRMALVGLDPAHGPTVPESWNLPVGLFSITNTLKTRELEPEDLLRAYWYYVTHQSSGLDWDIIAASLRYPGTHQSPVSPKV